MSNLNELTSEQVMIPDVIDREHCESPNDGGPFSLIDQLLRDRKKLLLRIESGGDLLSLARTMILTIFVAAGVFGASLGLFRGGVQILYAAVKLPMVILLTAAVTTSALTALRHGIEGFSEVRRDLALVLTSLALGSLVLAGLTPLVLLAVSWEVDYHPLILIVVGCCAVGGVMGLSLFVSGTKTIEGGGRFLVLSIVLLLFGLVGAQMTWTLRPYLVRPRTADVDIPFVRSLEGGFLDAVTTSTRSALGFYETEYPLSDTFLHDIKGGKT